MSAPASVRHQVQILDGASVKLPDAAPHFGRVEIWAYGVIGVAQVPFLGHGARVANGWDPIWTWQCQYRIDPLTHAEIVRQVGGAYLGGRFGPDQPTESAYMLGRVAAKFKLKYTIPLLAVKYPDRGQVQRLGAFYDNHRKKWYVLKGMNLEPFERWR